MLCSCELARTLLKATMNLSSLIIHSCCYCNYHAVQLCNCLLWQYYSVSDFVFVFIDIILSTRGFVKSVIWFLLLKLLSCLWRWLKSASSVFSNTKSTWTLKHTTETVCPTKVFPPFMLQHPHYCSTMSHTFKAHKGQLIVVNQWKSYTLVYWGYA